MRLTDRRKPATASHGRPRQLSAEPQAPAIAAFRQRTGFRGIDQTGAASTPPSPFKNVEVRDVNGDGVPDLWIYYNPQKPGEIIRQEEATQADGRVDTWSYFKDGKMVRREVDTRQSGRPDTVYFYDNDKIVREERDESGQGV